MADIFTQRYNSFFRDALRRCFGPIQTDARLREIVPDGPMRAFLLELNQGSGFSFLCDREELGNRNYGGPGCAAVHNEIQFCRSLPAFAPLASSA